MKPLIRFVVPSLALAVVWGQSNKAAKTDDELWFANIRDDSKLPVGKEPVKS